MIPARGPHVRLVQYLGIPVLVRCNPLNDASCSELQVRSSLNYNSIFIAGFGLQFSSFFCLQVSPRRGEGLRLFLRYTSSSTQLCPFLCHVCSNCAALVA